MATEKLQEVTVTAQRAKLAFRVQKFVKQIVAPENKGADGIGRWQPPPALSGLTEQLGEFLLERLSGIARKAGPSIGSPTANSSKRERTSLRFA